MSSVDIAKKMFQNYVDKAADLAESVKRNIVHEGVIDDETVVKLNNFIIASNEIADMPLDFTDGENEDNITLN